MENIIQELIRIEDQARRVVEQAEADKKFLAREIAASGEKIARDSKAATEESVRLLWEKSAGEAQAEIARIGEEKERRYLALEREFAAQSGEWESALFQTIVRG
jgi:hypothetical protein